MIIFSRKGIRIGEQYFSDDVPHPLPAVDLLRMISILSPATSQPSQQQGHTLIIDLRQDEDTIFAQMDKGTRYEVRRALTKDNLTLEQRDAFSADDLTVFCDFYDAFAKDKALHPIFRPRLEQLAQQGMLALSSVYDENRVLLTQHAYLRSCTRAALLYSASHFRQSTETCVRSLIGRANRCLHWQDMLYFKQRGVEAYDMGGIDAIGRTPETALIAEFKKGFGGSIFMVDTKTMACSLKGQLAEQALSWFHIRF